MAKLIGKYELHEVIGKGGFGTVYRATDRALEKVVALKVLHPYLIEDPGATRRFEQEARTAAQLDHPNIVPVYDVGQDGEYHYIAMKYLPGGSLADRIARGPIPFEQALSILRGACAGLQEAHKKGLIHRDLKPANLLFDADGRAVITDFGLAKTLTESSGGLSDYYGGVGTPFYRAPEVWKGSPPASPATDVYALGCIFYEMLAGQVLFGGPAPDVVMYRHLEEVGIPEGWQPQGAPAGLREVLLKTLAKDPAARCASADAFRLAVEEAMQANERAQKEEAHRKAEAARRKEEAEVRRWNEELAMLGWEEAALLIPRLENTWRINVEMERYFKAHASTWQAEAARMQDKALDADCRAEAARYIEAENAAFQAALEIREMDQAFKTTRRGEAPLLDLGTLENAWREQADRLNAALGVSQRTVSRFVALANACLKMSLPQQSETDLLREAKQLNGAWEAVAARLEETLKTSWQAKADLRRLNEALVTAWREEDRAAQQNDAEQANAWREEAARRKSELESALRAEAERLRRKKENEPPLFDSPERKLLKQAREISQRAEAAWLRSKQPPAERQNALVPPMKPPPSVERVPQKASDQPQRQKAQAADGIPERSAEEPAASNPEAGAPAQPKQDDSCQSVVIGLVVIFTVIFIIVFLVSRILNNLAGTPPTGPTSTPEGRSTVVSAFITKSASATLPPAPLVTATRAPRPAQLEGGAGKIAFASTRDGNREIYVMNADGSDPVNLTVNSSDDFSPAWSPDGTCIAYVSDRDGNAEIYVMNADGSDPTRLTDTPASEGGPAWSPDGARIAFVSDRDGNAEIYLMNADGSNPVNLTVKDTFDSYPTWSPDGARIAFVSDVGNYEIFMVNADGSNLTRLTDTPGDEWFPAWSPEGARIAYTSNIHGISEIYVMNARGSSPTQLTDNPGEDRYPAWSPDSANITFSSKRDGDYEIYVMNSDGSSPTRLTDNTYDDTTPSWQPAPKP